MVKRLSIEEQLAELELQKEILYKKRDQIRANKKFLCVCGAEHKIKDCDTLQSHWHEPSHGYEDGGWYSGEIHIMCPDHNIKNRLLFTDHPNYQLRNHYDHSAEMQFSRLFKKLFKKVTNDYKEDKTPWRNNYYIDKNHKKFGIEIK